VSTFSGQLVPVQLYPTVLFSKEYVPQIGKGIELSVGRDNGTVKVIKASHELSVIRLRLLVLSSIEI